jgi:hypothetical protein
MEREIIIKQITYLTGWPHLYTKYQLPYKRVGEALQDAIILKKDAEERKEKSFFYIGDRNTLDVDISRFITNCARCQQNLNRY